MICLIFVRVGSVISGNHFSKACFEAYLAAIVLIDEIITPGVNSISMIASAFLVRAASSNGERASGDEGGALSSELFLVLSFMGRKYLQTYLDEYSFRFNREREENQG